MKNMSFAMTTEQMRRREKTVTRRFGWWNLKPGDRIRAVEKAMGIPKGGKVVPIGIIEVVSVRQEPLRALTDDIDYGNDEMRREGFPLMTPFEFVGMIVLHYRATVDRIINRIEFKFVEEESHEIR